MSEPQWSNIQRLWSLLDMVENFRIKSLQLVKSGLEVLIGVSVHNQEFIEQNGGYTNQELLGARKHQESLKQAITEVTSLISLAEPMFANMQCVHINHAIKTLQWWVTNDKKKWSELKARSISLRDAIDNELNEHLYYQYPKIKTQKLRSFEVDWKAAIDGFPSVVADAFSATDCYAMGHNTASVFHCMRVLEYSLAALAADLGLSFDVQQWHNIIEQIEAKIVEQRKTLPKGAEKNERLQFLSEAAKEFFYFKDGWRNYVSHNRGKYDDYQSVSILEHTRSFTCHLASQLSE